MKLNLNNYWEIEGNYYRKAGVNCDVARKFAKTLTRYKWYIDRIN